MWRGLCLFATLIWGHTALAAQSANCWYPVDDPVGCSAEPVQDSSGFLKPGIHAVLAGPVKRYGHNILGDTPEWSRLEFLVMGSARHGPYLMLEYSLPAGRIFEDVTPRLVDVDGDGQPEIVVVETDLDRGARLSVYRVDQGAEKISLLAATPHIGTAYRWLAPAGVADFNGDGLMDFAYVDRPHLARTLRVWSLKSGQLQEIASLPDVTNHKIGDDSISGGLRNCGSGIEMVLLDGRWQNVLAVRMKGGQLTRRTLGRFKNRRSLRKALDCQPL